MALTQQLARVSPAYLERCRQSALDSPGGAPGWDPPRVDVLDTDVAVWGMIHYARATGAEAETIAALDRAIDGDPGGDVGFLDHDEVYDGITDPPQLLAPDAVRAVSRAPDAIDVDAFLAGLPSATDDAAQSCGFERGFAGDVREYLVRHFSALRAFYGGAARRGWCVVAWID